MSRPRFGSASIAERLPPCGPAGAVDHHGGGANLVDESARLNCIEQARAEFVEHFALCRDQYDARLEACDELGEAKDMAEVVGVLDEPAVRGKTYHNLLQTRDVTPVQPDVLEYKYYAPGIGVVLEENPENGERLELVRLVMP